jgi:(2Fe-2S) ferredoxin
MGQFEQHVFICTSGSWCPGKDGDALGVHSYLKQRVKEAGLGERVRINHSGCLDQCGHGPMIVIYPENVWYAAITVDDARAIFEEHLLGGKPVERLVYRPAKPGKNKLPRDEHEQPIGRPERQIVIRRDEVKAQ